MCKSGSVTSSNLPLDVAQGERYYSELTIMQGINQRDALHMATKQVYNTW